MQGKTFSIGDLYSRALDFPDYNGTSTIYLVASAARSGSTLLCTMLWETGCLGAPMEYLNLKNSLSAVMDLGNGSIDFYWKEIKKRRTSPNGIFGVKMFWNYMKDLSVASPLIYGELLKEAKIILLDRTDKIGQAISLVRAMQTGAWFSGDEPRSSAQFDAARIEWAIRRNNEEMSSWERMMEISGIIPFRVDYEQILDDRDSVITRVFRYLGAQREEDARVILPVALERQSSSQSEKWRRMLEKRPSSMTREDDGTQ